ncbi:MAG TPA: hypothetical protein VIK89_13790 [Cytophagaceae bacterium]
MKKLLILLFIIPLILSLRLNAQELFPATEPASTLPKGLLGARFMYEGFKEVPSERKKHWSAIRLMYGVTGKLTLQITGTASNHHPKKFPADFRNYLVNHHQKVFIPDPYIPDGFNIYAKYRWLSIDDKQKHLRFAFYGEFAKAYTPHSEAEPLLMGGDNTGVGGGLIITQLYKRFAVSFTYGLAFPFEYVDKEQDITFKSGNAINYNLSFGYRIYPAQYSGYDNLNINLYVEFINKQYEKAYMTAQGKYVDFDFIQYEDQYVYKSLQENKYSEIRPSLQFIFNSNTRVDVGVAHPFINQSYLHFYPMYFINVQKYFFRKTKK